MINLRKNSNIILVLFRLKLHQILEYRINFFFDIGIRFFEFVVFFLFWKIILSARGTIPGWGIESLLILYAFEQIYLALFLTFAAGAYQIEKEITRGGIDKYLCRPVEPWFVIMGEHSYFSIGGFIVGLGTLGIVHFMMGINIFTPIFPFLLLMTVLASIITGFFGLIFGAISFWIGRTKIFNYSTEAFWEFDSYPITLFPGYIQTLSAFVIPYIFANAIPTLAAIGTISYETVFQYLGLEILVLSLNAGIFLILWKKGVRRYESYGG